MNMVLGEEWVSDGMKVEGRLSEGVERWLGVEIRNDDAEETKSRGGLLFPDWKWRVIYYKYLIQDKKERAV